MSSKTETTALFLAAIALLSAILIRPAMTQQTVQTDPANTKNVILIGWDGVQRNHLFELLNRSRLPNLAALVQQGAISNITTMDHGTDTKAGWTQVLTGCRWWRTGVFNNLYWFHGIPANYTIPERVENYFGKDNVATGFITGCYGHMEIWDRTGDAACGRYTQEAIYRNIPSTVDLCSEDERNASLVGPTALYFLDTYAKSRFFAFFHFSDPDNAGHLGGENSDEYEQAIELCDNWLGHIVNRLDALNLTQKTLIYVTADHGFDEDKYSHYRAPYTFLATNDKNVTRNGDQVDVAPTVYYGLGMWSYSFNPELDGYPLQLGLPEGVEQDRQNKLADATKPKVSISPNDATNAVGTINVTFTASDEYMSTVLLVTDNNSVISGPWIWRRNTTVDVKGSYTWDIARLSSGSHTLAVLAFDEHGADHGPSISAITVTKESPDTPDPMAGMGMSNYYSSPSPTCTEIQPTHTRQPENRTAIPSATPPTTPPSDNPQTNQQTSDAPINYTYVAEIAAIVTTAAGAICLLLKRKR